MKDNNQIPTTNDDRVDHQESTGKKGGRSTQRETEDVSHDRAAEELNLDD